MKSNNKHKGDKQMKAQYKNIPLTTLDYCSGTYNCMESQPQNAEFSKLVKVL